MRKETFNLRIGVSSFKAILQFKAISKKGVGGFEGLEGCFLTHTENCQFFLGNRKGAVTVWPSGEKTSLLTLLTPGLPFLQFKVRLFYTCAPMEVSGTVYATT